jgi:LysM repeat protein
MKNGCAIFLAILLGVVLGGCSKEDPRGFPKVDYNKDGKVIFEELIIAFPDLTVEEFLAADVDHSGDISDKEYQRFYEVRKTGKKLTAASAPPVQVPSTAAAKPAPTPASAPASAPAAKPVEAAAPAEPAKPVEDVKAAAPARAEPPAAVAAPQAAGPAETVETVEVGTTPPAATAPEVKTYVVERGDTLSRIAKKFGVGAKALMDANNVKNADRLEAGASLTIPATGEARPQAPTSAASPAVTRFVAAFFSKSNAGDLNGLLDCYGETVDYYKKGKAGTDVVRQDKAEYFSRWPERSYKPGAASVEDVAGGDLRVTVPTSFVVNKGDKRVQGEAKFVFRLRPAGESFRIVGEQSVVTEKK